MMTVKRRYRVGDWVEVRSRAEILATLDKTGRLDGMPFMPEMFAFCGQRFRICKRAHKTCDTVFPIRGRRLADAVHLETRCSGEDHGGCQAGCLIFWKTAWLKAVDGSRSSDSEPPADRLGDGPRDTHAVVFNGVFAPGPQQPEDPVYVCQATQLPYMTSDLNWWDVRQYVEDFTSGNVTLRQILSSAVYSAYYNLSQAGIGVGRPMRWLYDKLCWIWGGPEFPGKPGKLSVNQPTPRARLDLRAGELVRIKSHREILETVNAEGKNRGMYWDAEMVPYCGGTYRVLRSVTKIINEQTGKMQAFATPCVILDGVMCQSRYSRCRLFCPRSIYSYWREIWVERV